MTLIPIFLGGKAVLGKGRKPSVFPCVCHMFPGWGKHKLIPVVACFYTVTVWQHLDAMWDKTMLILTQNSVTGAREEKTVGNRWRV